MTETRPDSTAGTIRRVIASGLAFLSFALGALLLSLFAFLPILLLPVSWQRKRTYSRWVLSRALRLFIGYIQLGKLILPTNISGLEYLQHSGQLIVAVHPGLIDVLLLIALVQRANCIVKAALWRNPVTIAPVHALGYIRNDAPDLIDQCAHSLRQGDSLIIFPEGTRRRPGKPLKFLRGAANIALAAGQDITPIVIRCEPPLLAKGQKWYQVPNRTPQYSIEVFPPMAIAPYLESQQVRSRLARQLTRDMEQFFSEQEQLHR